MQDASFFLIVRVRLKLWYLPLLGVILGILYAFMFIHGLIVTWHWQGKPSEDISEIIGVVNGKSLFVRTVSGDIYSLENMNYLNRNHLALPPILWTKVENHRIEPDPIRKPNMTFISWPLPFRVKQLYETMHPLVEGEMLTKYALSEDGNLWVWNYGAGGMASLTYFIFPIIGLFIDSILFLVIKVGIFMWTKIMQR